MNNTDKTTNENIKERDLVRKQIEDLKAENDVLKEENQARIAENQKLNQMISDKKLEVNELTRNYNKLFDKFISILNVEDKATLIDSITKK